MKRAENETITQIAQSLYLTRMEKWLNTISKRGGLKMKIIDKIIDIIAITAIIAILTGLFIAIWFGYIGLKIAASGTVVFAAAWILNTWARIEKKLKEGTK